MGNQAYTRRQLFEMDACTNCQECALVCPAVSASQDGELSSVHRLRWMQDQFKRRGGFLGRLLGRKPCGSEDWQSFSETVYRCTLCGNCQEVCPVGIGLKGLWLSLRDELAHKQTCPEKIGLIQANLQSCHNVFAEDNEERCEWVEDLDDPPDHGFEKDTAQVVYFTGCVASFFPMAQQIPVALAEIFQAGEVDFTLMGEDEWCCGFPLLGAGLLDQAQETMEHNLAAVKERGAKEVVFACPSCYMMWKEHYPAAGLKLTHATQFLSRLLAEKRLPLRELDLKVTFHDPCDLGRGAREFEAPREVIRALPGVELVELAQNRENCQCCGGGGNLEMIDAELSAKIAQNKISQVQDTGAQAVVTACQQCVRTMATHTRRNKLPLKVMDITELVRKALDV